MRILQVNKFLYRRGGAEGYMLDLVELQRGQGHQVELFGMEHPDNDPDQPLRETFPPNVELEPPPGGLRGVSASARMVWSVSGARGMERALERLRPDIVHCHNIYHQLSPSILRPVRRAGIACVMTLHDYKLACPSYQLLDHGELCDACLTGGLRQAALRRCKSGSLTASALLAAESGIHRLTRAYGAVDLFISPSHFLADVMARAGVFPERMRVVNHFADVASTPPATAPGDGLVFAGRLSREKGVDVLIEAVGRMSSETRLSVAGDGPERAALETLAERVAPGRVRFHGRLGKADLQRLVGGSAISVVPSRWHENQPMTILESFGAGVPVVATDLGGMPELVRDGLDGAVVPAGDPAILAATLARLLADPEGTHRMGVRARARVESDFSIETHLKLLDEVYAEAHERAAARRTDARSTR